jgi:ribokinase
MACAILVVGSYVQDLTFHTPRFPRPGQTVPGRFVMGPGGKGSNQAVAARRAGASTAFVGSVGDDPFADAGERFHAAEGIQSRLVRIADAATAAAGICVNDQGENQIIVALGASDRLGIDDVPADWIAGARMVACQLESNLATTAEVLRRARAAGAAALLNPAPIREGLDPAMLRHADVLVPNESELVGLAARLEIPGHEGLTDAGVAALGDEALHRLCRRMNVPTVIVTLGSQGCFVSLADGCHRLPALRGMSVVDTTGAGDAFVGGFCARWIETAGDVLASARFANVTAGLSVTRHGTAPAMPHRSEIDTLLARA